MRFRDRGYAVLVPSWPGLDGEPAELRRDLSRVPDVSVEQICDHYEGVIRGLDRPPIVIGHSFGGGFTQVLLDRGFGAAAVVLGSAPTKGILRLPFTTIRSVWGILANPAQSQPRRPVHRRPVPLCVREHALRGGVEAGVGALRCAGRRPRGLSRRAREPQQQFAFQGRLREDQPCAAPLHRGRERARRLAILNRLNVAKYKEANPDAVVEYKEYPARSHFTPVEPGWEAVADYALEWAVSHVR